MFTVPKACTVLWRLLPIALPLVFCIPSAHNAQSVSISNPGFETWRSITTYLAPDSFYTTDEVMGLGIGAVSRTTDAHSGQYAVLINNVSLANILPGSMTYGKCIKSGTTNYFMGWPFSSRPATLRFWYKFVQGGTDTALAMIALSRYDNGHQIIGTGTGLFYNATPVYQQAQISITYQSPLAPDTVIISFISAKNAAPSAGTKLFIDDIDLQLPTGGEEAAATAYVFELAQNYPNPGNPVTTITYSLPVEGNASVTIYNTLGRQVAQPVNRWHTAGRHTVTVSTESLPAGIYFYKLQAGRFHTVKKFSVLK